MTSTVLYVVVAAGILVLLTGVFRVEDARGGQLVVLVRVRRLFDRFVCFLLDCAQKVSEYVRYSFMRLFFHYAAHRILKRLYAFTHFLETKTEELLRQNRRVAKRIDAEKRVRSHLDDIADYKKETALSTEEIDRLRSLD